MTATAPLLDAILSSPCLPDYAEVINARLREEHQRRQRFYAEMSDEHKMEFIEGEIILHSPARNWHLVAKKHLMALLDMHVRIQKLGHVVDEKCLCVFPRNDYEPDIVFFGPDKAATFKPDTLKFPVPDLAVEVLSESTEKRDRGVKFTDYEAHGVSEYWIIDPESQTLEQYVKREGAFQLQTKSGSGEVRSDVVPGFCIPIPAIFDDTANLAALRAML
jgi:Uma2 family endonuclease